MGAELLVAVIVVALDCRDLYRAVYLLDAYIRLGVTRLGQAMVDTVAGTGGLKAMDAEGFVGRDRLLNNGGGQGDVAGCHVVSAVVGGYRVHLVGHDLDEMAEEVAYDCRVAFSCTSTKANLVVRSTTRGR